MLTFQLRGPILLIALDIHWIKHKQSLIKVNIFHLSAHQAFSNFRHSMLFSVVSNQVVKALLLVLCFFVKWNGFVTIMTPVLHFMIIFICHSGEGSTKSGHYCLNFTWFITRCRDWSLLLVRLSRISHYCAFFIFLLFPLPFVLDFVSSWLEGYHTFRRKWINFKRFLSHVLLLLLAFWTTKRASELSIFFVRHSHFCFRIFHCCGGF